MQISSAWPSTRTSQWPSPSIIRHSAVGAMLFRQRRDIPAPRSNCPCLAASSSTGAFSIDPGPARSGRPGAEAEDGIERPFARISRIVKTGLAIETQQAHPVEAADAEPIGHHHCHQSEAPKPVRPSRRNRAARCCRHIPMKGASSSQPGNAAALLDCARVDHQSAARRMAADHDLRAPGLRIRNMAANSTDILGIARKILEPRPWSGHARACRAYAPWPYPRRSHAAPEDGTGRRSRPIHAPARYAAHHCRDRSDRRSGRHPKR